MGQPGPVIPESVVGQLALDQLPDPLDPVQVAGGVKEITHGRTIRIICRPGDPTLPTLNSYV